MRAQDPGTGEDVPPSDPLAGWTDENVTMRPAAPDQHRDKRRGTADRMEKVLGELTALRQQVEELTLRVQNLEGGPKRQKGARGRSPKPATGAPETPAQDSATDRLRQRPQAQ